MRLRFKLLGVATVLLLVLVVLVKLGFIRGDPRIDGDVALARGDERGLRVLFVGNSLTFYNRMPALVHNLAAGAPDSLPIYAVQFTAGGWSLDWFAEEEEVPDVLEGVDWDVVVLQENSFIPSSPAARQERMFPAARSLDARIESVGAETMLFMTWGYENGDPTVEGDDYDSMQERIRDGYVAVGQDIGADVVPVGLAWEEAMQRKPALNLWIDDGRHPALEGSYLAACVFYKSLTGRDPAKSTFTGDLQPELARVLQEVATEVVERY